MKPPTKRKRKYKLTQRKINILIELLETVDLWAMGLEDDKPTWNQVRAIARKVLA